MADVMLEKPIKVHANTPIEIGLRFTVGEEFFCGTVFGYGGSNYERCCKENERGAFVIADCEMSTKGETEVEYGQIPKIYYF